MVKIPAVLSNVYLLSLQKKLLLTSVDEIEVSRVVESCKNKLSTDSNGLSMNIVKRIRYADNTYIM